MLRLTRCLFAAVLVSAVAGRAAAADPPIIRDPAYARPDQMVQVEPGRRLNLYCLGAGAPTVVFESGLAGDMSEWGAVQPVVARRARACVHDRAGIGFSDPPRRTEDSANIADDLHRLLRAAGIPPPYVIVAHSYGGLPARDFARRYPGEVVGMVLVDTTSEDEIRVKRAVQPSFETGFMAAVYASLDACAAQAKVGFKLGSEQLQDCVADPDPHYSDAINAVHLAQHQSTTFQETVRNESLAVASGRSGEEVHAIGLDLGDIPLVVLTAPRPTGTPPPGVTPELRAALNRLYTEGMQAVARRSSRGEYQAVTDTGHFIQLDRPQVVEDAIDRVLDEARARN